MTDAPAPADDAPERTKEQRLVELAERLCRSYTYGVGLEELQKTDPEDAEAHRDAAEHLLPWIDEAPKREIREAFGRGYDKGRDRGRASQARRVELAQRVAQSAARDAATALPAQLTAEAAIERVRRLHERRKSEAGPGAYCDLCSNHGDTTWPCATIRAINEQQTTTAEADHA